MTGDASAFGSKSPNRLYNLVGCHLLWVVKSLDLKGKHCLRIPFSLFTFLFFETFSRSWPFIKLCFRSITWLLIHPTISQLYTPVPGVVIVNTFEFSRYEDALMKLKAAFKVESKEHSYYTRLMGDICHCQMKVLYDS